MEAITKTTKRTMRAAMIAPSKVKIVAGFKKLSVNVVVHSSKFVQSVGRIVVSAMSTDIMRAPVKATPPIIVVINPYNALLKIPPSL